MRNACVFACLILAAGLCLVLAGRLGAGDHDAGGATGESLRGAPPGVRFVMVALGGFRGLLADALWVRASDLQDEGDFFEVAQLTEWITALEPRSPEIWAYHAWNLAYNIAAIFPSPPDRWRWVQNGIRLLRDKGIPANAEDPRLYWELGWLYADKVSGRWDEAGTYYRVSLANEITRLLGGGEFRPERLRRDPAAAERLRAEGLQPETLAQADARYGPLDWRLPESHALYWGLRGQPFQKADARWCDRLIWNALTETVRGGVLYLNPDHAVYLRGPRLDVAIKGVRQYEAARLADTPLTAMAGENFLREALLYLHAFGRTGEAGEALTVLRRVRGNAAAPADVETAVRQDLARRLDGADSAVVSRMIEELLRCGEMWKVLNQPAFAAGFERLARLHWDAFAALSGTSGAPAGEATWDDLRRRAAGRVRRDGPAERSGP